MNKPKTSNSPSKKNSNGSRPKSAGQNRTPGLKADYKGATPEQVAKALLLFRPGIRR